MPHIPPHEYRNRLENLRLAIRVAGLDLFIVSSFDSIYYLTGAEFEPLERPFFLLVRPDATAPELLVPRLDKSHMQRAARGVPAENIHTYWEFPAPVGRRWLDRLRTMIEKAHAVGIEPSLRADIAEHLHEHHPRVEPLVERLRLVKSRHEIEMIAQAAQYADLGVERLMAASYYGSSVAEGFAEGRTIMSRIVREVDEWEPLTTKVILATWPAPASARPHSIPKMADRLREGPHVALALTRVNGYAAESERTYFTAPPTDEMRHAFAAMLRAREVAFTLVRPGVPCAEIDAAVNAFLQREYPDYQTEEIRLHRTGHGIGLGNHEAPWVAVGSDDVLAPNMVISVEPGIYLPEIGGFRHSDTVLVTETGHELLTQFPNDLAALTIQS